MNNTIWDQRSILALMELPLFDLVSKSYAVHKQHFKELEMELCTLSSIKTGACPENCAYCPQSAHYNTGLKKEKLLQLEYVIEQATVAKQNGATRFCMGAAWRSPPKAEFPKVLAMIKTVKALGLETCVTLGLLNKAESERLKAAGLDYYNHNLDTSPEYYKSIISTRTYENRLETIEHIAAAGINICCGGILGMGESQDDRIKFLLALTKLPKIPKSIPINKLIPIPGTPLANAAPLNHFELIKIIAITRLMFPTSMVRLSAGRESMPPEAQAWCFMAGANSIFIGEKLLTTNNPDFQQDQQLLQNLGFKSPSIKAAEF